MAINIGNFVKWPVSGGMGYGKVVGLDGDKASIEAPNDLILEVVSKNLVNITEEEYNDNIETLIQSISKKNSKGKGKKTKSDMPNDNDEDDKANTKGNQMTIEQLQAELEKVKKDLSEAATKVTALEAEKATLAKSVEEATNKTKEAEAKLEKIAKDALAKKRFDELKAVDSIGIVGDTDDAAMAALASMDQKTYDLVIKAAKTGFSKLTDQTKTGLPKSTDQTQTNLPKLTEAELKAKADEDLAKAKKEEITDKGAATISEEKVEPETALLKWTSNRVYGSKKNSKK